jgi:hypothetical protein
VSQKLNSDLIAIPSEQNLLIGLDQRGDQPDFSAPPAKNIRPIAPGSPALVTRDRVFRYGSLVIRTTVMYRKDNFTHHMTLCEALMRLGRPGERIRFGDRNLKLGGMHCHVEALEFANA